MRPIVTNPAIEIINNGCSNSSLNFSTKKYNGNTIYADTETSGTVTIMDFDRSAPMTIRPPEHSNVDFTLGVSAVSVDTLGVETSTSAAQNEQIQILIKGVADPAILTTATPVFTEAGIDTTEASVLIDGFGSADLSQVITGASLIDSDGSENLPLKISGLDPQFTIVGASFIGGTGVGRSWLLTQDQLADAKILLPINYSGTVTADVVAITTENDGHSQSNSSVPLSFTVTPSIDEAIKTSTNNLKEDTLGKVDFSLVVPTAEVGDVGYRVVDTDEFLSSIWIDEADPIKQSHLCSNLSKPCKKGRLKAIWIL